MTPSELKAHFQTIELPGTFRLSEWEDITNVRGFLSTQFQLVEQAGINYDRTPAWDRLLRFKDAVGGS